MFWIAVLRTRIGWEWESPTPITKDGKFHKKSFPEAPLSSITLFAPSIVNKVPLRKNTLSVSHIQIQTLFSLSTTLPHLASQSRANPPTMSSSTRHLTLPPPKLFLFLRINTCSSLPLFHHKEPLYSASGNTPRAPSSCDRTRPLHFGMQTLQVPT